jgi:hypothetical protein
LNAALLLQVVIAAKKEKVAALKAARRGLSLKYS